MHPLEPSILKLMDDCRKEGLSTAVELLELVLAEVRERGGSPKPTIGDEMRARPLN